MSSYSVSTDDIPVANYKSRKTMLCAERKDTIKITSIEQHFETMNIPLSYEVIQRTETYFGPELLLASNNKNYLLTAPGPASSLLLWYEEVNENGHRISWKRTAEVRTKIDSTPKHEVCNQCGKQLRSNEHKRLSLIGRCPDGS